MTRAAETQPWLLDDEVWAVYAGAWLEDRPVEDWELNSTDYYQSLNSAEKQWINLFASEPESAARLMDDNRIKVADMFRDVGVEGVSDQLVNYMAQRFTHGNWSAQYLDEQIWALTGSPTSHPVDSAMNDWMTDQGIQLAENQFRDVDVKSEFNKWLGPRFLPNDAEVKEWAAKLRRSPDAARDELTEYLRTQRMTLFPEYENPNLTYQDIAAPWRSFTNGVWGQIPDERDDVFMEVLRLNDATEAGKLLRREGLNRNIGAVQQSVLQGIERQSQRVVNPV
jgi:hypothetical protein